ncbi:MAG: cytochrome c-type biogenesis protein [Cellulomonas sp.]|nr:cytochrome c-type biogenesis protein CcmH [Rickettsiella sp.]
MIKNIKIIFRQLILFLSVLASVSVCSAKTTELYPFNSVVQKKTFQHMILDLRCLVCQNQNLADSNALFAQDLRQIIYQRIIRGESEEHIKIYLVSRYGEFILFKPLFSPLTYLLWLGPFILLLTIIVNLFSRRFLKK